MTSEVKLEKLKKLVSAFAQYFSVITEFFFLESRMSASIQFEIIVIPSKVLMYPRILSLSATRMQRLFYVIPKRCDLYAKIVLRDTKTLRLDLFLLR